MKGDTLGIMQKFKILALLTNMNKLKSVRENKTYKILWNFEIEMDYPIPARRLDLVLINKKKRICHLVGFAIPGDH